MRGDGTSELWQSNRLVGHQTIDQQELLKLVEQMLNLNFFELRDVFDRGTTRHEQSYRLSLHHLGRDHSVGFDDNRFAVDLQNIAGKIREIAHRDSWEPKPGTVAPELTTDD
jgi:hypothetical protein